MWPNEDHITVTLQLFRHRSGVADKSAVLYCEGEIMCLLGFVVYVEYGVDIIKELERQRDIIKKEEKK